MRPKKIFNVVSRYDGEIVFKGTAMQISDVLGYDDRSVATTCKLHRVAMNKYYFEESGTTEGELEKTRYNFISKPESELEIAIRHLKIYGNMYVKKEPIKLIEQLKQEGINATYRKGMYDGYVLERVNDVIC